MKPAGKTQFHSHVLLVITATNQQLSAQIAVLAMLARDQTHLPHLHLAYVRWVITVLTVCRRLPVQQVHLVISLVQRVKQKDVHLVLLVISAQQGQEVTPPIGLCTLLQVKLGLNVINYGWSKL